VIAKITGKDGLVTIDVLEPGTSSEYRIGINHIAKIELKCESGTSTAYACPAAWGAEKI
jgi:hypothetical protein